MKTKSILLIAGTLIIGIIIGFLSNGYLTQQKFKRFVHQGSYDNFKHRILEVIKPNESQLTDIEPILEKYALEANENIERTKEKMKTLHEDMLKDLAPYLREDQITRIEGMKERFKKVWERPRDNPPPPHHRRPGPKR